MGKPLAINSGIQLFYPVSILWGLLVGWSEWSYLLFLAAHLMAGAWLSAVFARRIGATFEASLFTGLAFAGNGYVLGLLSDPSLMVPFLLWPLLGIALFDLHSQKRGPSPGGRTRACQLLALGLVLIETGGYPLTKLIVFGATILVYLALAWKKGPAWRPILVATAIAIVCTAPEWVCSLLVLRQSDRMGADIYHETTYGSPRASRQARPSCASTAPPGSSRSGHCFSRWGDTHSSASFHRCFSRCSVMSGFPITHGLYRWPC
jgi:hypothetical protein